MSEKKVDGPLLPCSGPHDYEGQGRERYWDTPEAERPKMRNDILAQLKPGTPEPDRRFANGWLAEHARDKRANGGK